MIDRDAVAAYEVTVERSGDLWRVRIVDADGTTIAERPCADAAQARTYASTVRQHRYWLSPERFRSYYAPESGGSRGSAP